MAYSKTIEMVKEGRRYYFTGNTYNVRQELKDLGATWDGARKAWWVSSTRYNAHADAFNDLVVEESVPMATKKQVEYAVSLGEQVGESVNVRAAERMTMDEMSEFIEDLKQKKSVKREEAKRPSVRVISEKEEAPAPRVERKASEKQVDYAWSLLSRHKDAWFDSSFGDGNRMPSYDELSEWSAANVTQLINELKY